MKSTPDPLGLLLLVRALDRPSGARLPDNPLDLLTADDKVRLALEAQARRLDEFLAEVAALHAPEQVQEGQREH